jgi:exosome complex exonuclease RRP6
MLDSIISQLPEPLASTPISLIDTEEDLKNLCEILSNENAIAVDVEVCGILTEVQSLSTCSFVPFQHHSYRSFLGLTCLIQISTRKQDFLLDSIALREHLHLLNSVFSNPKIVKAYNFPSQSMHLTILFYHVRSYTELSKTFNGCREISVSIWSTCLTPTKLPKF